MKGRIPTENGKGREHGIKGREYGKKEAEFDNKVAETWENATEEEREQRREGGRLGAAVAIANYEIEEIEEQHQAGKDEWN